MFLIVITCLISRTFLCWQKPPELDAPLFEITEEEKEAKFEDQVQEQMSVF